MNTLKMRTVRLLILCLMALFCGNVSAQWNMRVVLKSGEKVDYPVDDIEEVVFVDENGDVVEPDRPMEKFPVELLLSEGGGGTRVKAQVPVGKAVAFSEKKPVKVFMTKFGSLELARDEQTGEAFLEDAEVLPTQVSELSFYKSLPSRHWLLDYTQEGALPLKHYPSEGQFDFFAYTLDGAELLACEDVPDFGRTVRFAIDGIQDVMAGKAKNTGSSDIPRDTAVVKGIQS